MITTATAPAMQERVARSRDQLTPELAEELLLLLSEAALEILNNDIDTNPVYRRLRAMQARIDMAAMLLESDQPTAPLASANRATSLRAGVADCTDAGSGAAGSVLEVNR